MRKITLSSLVLLCLLAALFLTGCGDSKELVIEEGVTVIKDGAYRGRGFETVVIPSSVKRIGEKAFEKCGKLKSVVIPASVTEIGEGAFSWCDHMASVELNEGLTRIGEKAFEKCKSLTAVKIPASVDRIGAEAFYDCEALAEVTLDGKTKLSTSSFSGCKAVRSLTITGTELGERPGYVLQSSTVPASVTIPETVTAIGERAFSYCSSLTQITLPGTLTAIRGDAFYSCKALREIAIPDSVNAVANNAFEKTALETAVLPLIPADFSAARDLPVPLAELISGKKLLPVKDRKLYGSLFGYMPPAARTLDEREMDYILAVDVQYQERFDYSGAAFNTCTSAYLCARDCAVYRICDIWHTPSIFGIVKAGEALCGDVAGSAAIWEEIEKQLNGAAEKTDDPEI